MHLINLFICRRIHVKKDLTDQENWNFSADLLEIIYLFLEQTGQNFVRNRLAPFY